jgi:hypothetical protein
MVKKIFGIILIVSGFVLALIAFSQVTSNYGQIRAWEPPFDVVEGTTMIELGVAVALLVAGIVLCAMKPAEGVMNKKTLGIVLTMIGATDAIFVGCRISSWLPPYDHFEGAIVAYAALALVFLSVGVVLLPRKSLQGFFGTLVSKPDVTEPQKEVEYTCSDCGAKVDPNAKSCSKCGAKFD